MTGRLSAYRLVWLSVVWLACGRTVPTPEPTPPPLASAPAVESNPLPKTIDEAILVRAAGDLELYERALRSLTESADPQTQRRAIELRALFEIEQKRPDEALPLLGRAVEIDPLVAPWLRLRIATIQSDAGNYPDAIAALAGILRQTPSSSAATVARLRLPALYAMSGDSAATETSLRDAMTEPIDILSEEDFVALATPLANAGREELATAVRMHLLTEFPQGRFTEQTYELVKASTSAPLDALPLDEALALAARLGSQDRYDQEFDLLARVAQRFPDAAASPAYRAVRIRALFNSRRYIELLEETARIKLKDPALMFLRARAAWRADRPEEFLAGLRALERAYPRSAEATEAKVVRSKYYTTDVPKPDVAIHNLEAAIAAGVSGNEGENLWTLGWTYFLAARYDDALRTFDHYASQFPDGNYLDNVLFWTARINDRLGHVDLRDHAFDELLAKFPYSYYSYRARKILGQPPAAPSDVANGNVFPDVDAEVASLHEPRLDAVAELRWLGLQRDATREMKAIAATYPDNLGVAFRLADLYAREDEPFRAIGVLQRRFRPFVRRGGTGLPHRFWEILFPLKYWDTIRAEAERRQIDPYLIASIIRQESGFEPSTVSNAGAVGVMQIMPQEAGRIAAAAGIQPPSREQLFDPKVNIGIGAAEYVQKLAVMHGTDILAIAAYNAGEDAVGRWLAQTPIDDLDLFVESIPFSETRLYVKSVTRNRLEYRRIYEVPSQ